MLLHSPLTGAAAWGSLPAVLEAAGVRTAAVEVPSDDVPPYAQGYIAMAALAIASFRPAPPLALVAHSGAGPLLPGVALSQRAAGRSIGAYLFCDAGLPRPGNPTLLDLLRQEDDALASSFEQALRNGARYPSWTVDELAEQLPDRGARERLVGSLRPRGLDFFTEPLPTIEDWPDAPCAYLRTSAAYTVAARTARSRGWPLTERDTGHFAAMRDPQGVAEDLLALLDQL